MDGRIAVIPRRGLHYPHCSARMAFLPLGGAFVLALAEAVRTGPRVVIAAPAIERPALRLAVAQQRQLHGVSVVIPDHPVSPFLRPRAPHPTGSLDDRGTVPENHAVARTFLLFDIVIKTRPPDSAPGARIGHPCLFWDHCRSSRCRRSSPVPGAILAGVSCV